MGGAHCTCLLWALPCTLRQNLWNLGLILIKVARCAAPGVRVEDAKMPDDESILREKVRAVVQSGKLPGADRASAPRAPSASARSRRTS